MPCAGQCNRYHILNSAAEVHAAAARVAQEAHDTAVRDSQLLHEDACRMAQESHDTAMFDHQAAADLHDLVVSDPGFGCCGPFFDMTPVDFVVTIRNEYLLFKYTDILTRVNEFSILYDWDFDQSAEYLMLTKKECKDCINIIDIKKGSVPERIRKYLNIKD